MAMDIDEAIEWLYDLKHDIIYDEQAEALDMAIDLLGKQKPKKPKTILHDGENEWYVCPTCGIEIASISHHCKCGQAIDWEI